MEFYLHEDDWGMIDLVPEENRLRAAAATDESRSFGEQHRAPGGIGWTDVYVTPEMPISFAERALTLDGLRALLPELELCERVFSGYSTQRDEARSAFALKGAAGVLYGSLNADRVTRLHLCDAGERFLEPLVRLGRAHRLVLVDWRQDLVIALDDEAAVARWLHGDDDD